MSEILKSLQIVNEELGSIAKDQQGHGYKFRGIDQVFQNIGPLFKKHGVLVSRRNLVATHSIRDVEKLNKYAKTEADKYQKKQYLETFINSCDYVFTSTKDGSEFVTQGFGEGQDTSGGDKSSSMATSNSYKYVIFEMFSIPTAEQQDSDQVTAKVNASAKTVETKQEIPLLKKPGGSSGFRKKKKSESVETKHAI